MALEPRVVAIPAGRTATHYRVNVLFSAELTTDSTVLGQFPEWLDWPDTLSYCTFAVQENGGAFQVIEREQVADSTLWRLLFDKCLPVKRHGPTPEQKFESFNGDAVQEPLLAAYSCAAQQAHEEFVRRGKAAPQGPTVDPLPALLALHEEAKGWSPWLADNAPEADKAVAAILTNCLLDPKLAASTLAPISGALRRVAGRTDDRKSPPTCAELLGRLSPMTLRGLLEHHGRWADVNHCRPADGSPLLRHPVFATTQAATDEALDVYRAASMHRVMIPTSPKRMLDLDETSKTDRMDFQAFLAGLMQHPPLLPKLGLVVTLNIQAISCDTGTVAVKVTRRSERQQHGAPAAGEVVATYVSPRTHFWRSGATFIPDGLPSFAGRRITRGFLDMSLRTGAASRPYSLCCTSSHEAYLQLKAVGSQIGTGQETRHVVAAGQDNPNLRTAGLVLCEHHPDEVRSAAVARRRKQQQSPPSELFAEDLIFGFRVDVRVSGQPAWHSLCLRDTAFEIYSRSLEHIRHMRTEYATVAEAHAEGAINPSVCHPPDGGDPQVQEELCRWQNWSLAAPLPTKPTLSPQWDPKRCPPLVHARHTAKRLPRLIFGHKYDLRCRAMFLDGSGLDAATDSDPGMQVSCDFDRVEWIAAANTLLAVPLEASRNCGEELNTLAIRSNSARPSGQIAERYLIPPKVDASLAQYHGKWINKGTGAFRDRAMRADGSFISAYELRTGRPLPKATESDTVATIDRNPIWTAQRGGDATSNRYYPDPLAYELYFWLQWWPVDRDGEASREDHYEIYRSITDWPTCKPLKVRLAAAPDSQKSATAMQILRRGQSAAGQGATREDLLLITLRRGFTAKLLISWTPFDVTGDTPLAESVTRPNSVAVMRWIKPLLGRVSALGVAGKRALAANPLASTTLELRLVHATERPVLRPRFVALLTNPKPSEVAVPIKTHIRVHVPSTSRVDLEARWTDLVDPVGAPTNVLAVSVGAEDAGLREDKLSSPVSPSQLLAADAPRAAEVEACPFDCTHTFQDTKYHEVTYSVRATSRYAEFFEPPSTDAKPKPRFVHTGENEWRVKIPNRAIPNELKVEYAVPAFEWRRYREGGVYHSFRRGGLIRLYLQRPWNLTGNNEMLGVVVANGPDASTTTLSGRISRWGQDPIRESLGVTPMLTLGNFQGWSAHRTDVALLKPSDPTRTDPRNPSLSPYEAERVTVVGYLPKYPDRTSCYVDIELDPGSSYYPFASLAVGRFQNHSLQGMHLSQVIRLDMVQVPPHRWVQAWREHNQIVVRMFGYTHGRLSPREWEQSFLGTQLRVSVQQRTGGTEKDLCWSPAHATDGAQLLETVPAKPWASIPPGFVPPGFRPSEFLSHWEARLDAPSERFGVHYRVVVEELEEYLTEVIAGPGARPKAWANTEVARVPRVAFTEIVELYGS